MSEYISREAAKEAIVKAVSKGHSPFNAIVMLPAADVRSVSEMDKYCERCEENERFLSAHMDEIRPVVLCRNCKYSYDSVGGWCCSYGICVDCIVREDFYCADGEKREES